jgi:hypothetical protein
VLVADADGETDSDGDGDADPDGDADGEGDSDGEGDADPEADTDGEGDTDGDGEVDADGDEEADGDGDVLAAGGADEVASWWSATRWPVTCGPDPTVTCTLVPIAGGARSGFGAACPVTFPSSALAPVADAGT